MKKLAFALLLAAPACVFGHETLTTTVLFDREIVRILDKHCVMCHVENGPSFPLATYEQAWLQGRKIRASTIARHMPPWAAFPGYGQFANDNSLTLRETQFIVSWVEGLGPRNSGTVFTNTAAQGAARPKEIRAHVDFGHWYLGQPQLTKQLPPITVEPKQPNGVQRLIVDLGLKSERRLSALEFMPGDRRVVRAAFFSIRETGQWIGSWTPWYGFAKLPAGVAWRVPAGAHIVAEVHYKSVTERVTEQGTLGLHFADSGNTRFASDVVLSSQTRLSSAANILSLRPEIPPGVTSIELSARKPDGGTEVLLFAKEIPRDWPTPYILRDPVKLPAGTQLRLITHGAGASMRVTTVATK
jgi:hypothetical protein